MSQNTFVIIIIVLSLSPFPHILTLLLEVSSLVRFAFESNTDRWSGSSLPYFSWLAYQSSCICTPSFELDSLAVDLSRVYWFQVCLQETSQKCLAFSFVWLVRLTSAPDVGLMWSWYGGGLLFADTEELQLGNYDHSSQILLGCWDTKVGTVVALF